MTQGGKLLVTFGAIVLTVLVVYYGVLLPDGETSVTTDTPPVDALNGSAQHSAPATPAPSPSPSPAQAERSNASLAVNPPDQLRLPVGASSTGDSGLLSQAVKDAVGGETSPPADSTVEANESTPASTAEETEADDAAGPLGRMAPGVPLVRGDELQSEPVESAPQGQPGNQTGEPAEPVQPATLEEGSPTETAAKPTASPAESTAPATSGAATQPPAPLTPGKPSIDPRKPSATTRPQPAMTEYTIKAGDTGSSIAQQWFGDANKWILISKANPWVDFNRLQIGQKIKLPPKDAAIEPVRDAVDSSRTFTVRPGDTLAKIAREYYGSVALWELIYDANRKTIGDDPALLQVGMKLTMPPAPAPKPPTTNARTP